MYSCIFNSHRKSNLAWTKLEIEPSRTQLSCLLDQLASTPPIRTQNADSVPMQPTWTGNRYIGLEMTGDRYAGLETTGNRYAGLEMTSWYRSIIFLLLFLLLPNLENFCKKNEISIGRVRSLYNHN